ncbi:MAG TPA: oligosaccharide flippase family protein [Polyangiaceae bacterium]
MSTAGEISFSAAVLPKPRFLGSKLARGSLWALLGHGGGQLLRLAGNLVLWRLLYAEAFGLMAIVNVFMQGLTMFSDVGIGPSIIQSKRGDEPDYLNTAWTIQVVRGFALFAVAAVAAVPVANFYHQPQLAALIPVVSLGSILAGFNSTKLFTVTRHIALERLTATDLLSQSIGLCVMVGWAVVSRNIWALAIGGVVGNLARLALSHALLPGIRNRFRWNKPDAAALLHFGRWIFMSTLLTFVAMQSDRLIFGKLISMSMLGVYSVATIWSTFPTQILGHVFQSVIFPMLSGVHNENADVSAAYRHARAPWLIAAGWLIACLVSGGPTLIRFLYDERAEAAGGILQILSVGTWFLALEITNGCALLAKGRPKWIAAGSAAKLCGMAILIPAGFALYGFFGAVLGFAASELFRYLVSVLGAARATLRGFKQDLVLTGFVAATTLLGFAARELVRGTLGAPLLENHARAAAFLEGAAILLVLSSAWALIFAGHKRFLPLLQRVLLA